jgi:DNA-binding NtrC family response regulator
MLMPAAVTEPMTIMGRKCPELIGNSPVIVQLRKVIERVAAIDAPVLITGETGTGKELVANLLHHHSRRSDGPFIAVNCAALPDSLFQSEVFGYERGAFTGADRRNIGRIESAEGGTLLLDEIGDLPLENQVTLLRFLEEGSFERLGSCRPIRADVRIVAATHADLESACRTGQFRDDLYYRLSALRICTPALRERGNDVVTLARCFVTSFALQYEVEVRSFDDSAVSALTRHTWPGNVRELKNRILQALVMGNGRSISGADLGFFMQDETCTPAPEPDSIQSLRLCRKSAEREAIERALHSVGGNINLAARQLEVSRAQLYRLIKNHHLDHLPVRE